MFGLVIKALIVESKHSVFRQIKTSKKEINSTMLSHIDLNFMKLLKILNMKLFNITVRFSKFLSILYFKSHSSWFVKRSNFLFFDEKSIDLGFPFFFITVAGTWNSKFFLLLNSVTSFVWKIFLAFSSKSKDFASKSSILV